MCCTSSTLPKKTQNPQKDLFHPVPSDQTPDQNWQLSAWAIQAYDLERKGQCSCYREFLGKQEQCNGTVNSPWLFSLSASAIITCLGLLDLSMTRPMGVMDLEIIQGKLARTSSEYSSGSNPHTLWTDPIPGKKGYICFLLRKGEEPNENKKQVSWDKVF